MTFTSTTTVADLATRAPATIAVFQKHGIDFCCGGKRPLADVCAERAIPYDDLVVELTSAIEPAAPARITWDQRPLSDLTAHIVESFHDPLAAELPRLVAMARRVDERHGASSQPNAAEIARTLDAFTEDMLPHMKQEEDDVFPLIERLDRGEADALDAQRFVLEQTRLEGEHAATGRTLAALRVLTNGYRPADGSCPTTRGLYHGLGELESLMTLHVHLENNVLFPRARALAAGLR